MSAFGWGRLRWQRRDEAALLGALAGAATRGEALETILELAARSLLELSQADRAGVWVRGAAEPEALFGTVVDVRSRVAPEEWKRLDVSAPSFSSLLERAEPTLMDLGSEAHIAGAGPLTGMSTAAWFPLQIQCRALGLALVTFARPRRGIDTRLLWAVADELSLAIAQRQAQDASEVQPGFRFLLESSGERILLLDRRRIVQEGSRRALEYLTLPPSELGQVRLEELFSEPVRDAIVSWWESATRGPIQQGVVPMEAALRSGAVVRLNLRGALRGPSGTEHCWQVCLEEAGASREEGGDSGRAETELLAVLSSLDCGVLLLDARHQIRRINDRFAQLLALDPQRVKELTSFDALVQAVADHFRDPQAFALRWRELIRRGGEATWEELELVRPTRKVVERFARPVLDASGKRVGWLEAYRDISGQRLFQPKLVQTEKLAALGQLVSGIAHELNNPLTSIMGYAQLLLARPKGPERRADIRKIYQEAERAGRIVKNLLLFTRETEPERRGVNLNEIVERTLALRSYELKVENIAVELDLDPNLPTTLADAGQLQQVVLNLVVNAEQAIQQGRGHGQIRVRTRCPIEQQLILEVEDNGPGIQREIAARIFDPFFTTKPAGVGTGLGLSIVYGIVREHGGEITVESEPGRGATFRVELPVVAAQLQEPEPALPPAGPVDAKRRTALTQRERVLVVEDEPTVAQLIADVLCEEGYEVITVLDSREALARLGREDYDLVICDLKMPHLDGRTFYRSLVRAGSPLQQRLVFITGDTMTPHTLEFLEQTGLPYLAKPFLVEELKAAVQRALGNDPRGARVAAGAETPPWPSRIVRKQ